jgi:uncharacterized membrane protein YdbT with pleckstrin-like domain
MSYVDENLITGEKVTYRARLHWKVIAWPVIAAALLVIVALVVFGLGWSTATPAVYSIIGVLLLVAAAVVLIKAWITIKSAEFAVTNKRVILKVGFVQKDTAEMFLAKIESVTVDQTIAGRLLNYGSIVIRGTGGSLQPFSNLAKPLEFRRQIQEQIGRELEDRST